MEFVAFDRIFTRHHMSDSSITSDPEDGSIPVPNHLLNDNIFSHDHQEEETNLVDENNLHKSIRKRNPRQCLAPGCNKCSQGIHFISSLLRIILISFQGAPNFVLHMVVDVVVLILVVLKLHVINNFVQHMVVVEDVLMKIVKKLQLVVPIFVPHMGVVKNVQLKDVKNLHNLQHYFVSVMVVGKLVNVKVVVRFVPCSLSFSRSLDILLFRSGGER
jgi:hypothetical protein